MLVCTAEVLRQAEGVGLKIDGWVSGNDWFIIVGSCVELKLRLNANSTFIVKNNTIFFATHCVE